MKPLLPPLALLILTCATAHGAPRWNSAPYAAVPPLVTETREELVGRVTEISTFPTELDPRLWEGERLRSDVRQRSLEVVNSLFADLKLKDVSVKDVEVRGSNVSYEYDDAADFGVRVFLDTSAYKGSLEELAARIKTYNAFIEVKHEGRILMHGVPLEVNFYVIRTPRLDPVKGIGHYSISRDVWMETPTVQDDKFDRSQMLADMERFTSSYNALINAYFADKRSFDCQRWSAFSSELGDYRNNGINAGGSRSTENLVYRLLRRLKVNVVEEASSLGLECRNIQWSLE